MKSKDYPDFEAVMALYSAACAGGGTAFGIWQHSLAAGIFVAISLFILGTQL